MHHILTINGPKHEGPWKSPTQVMVPVQASSNSRTVKLPQNVATAPCRKCQDIEMQLFAFFLVLVASASHQSQ